MKTNIFNITALALLITTGLIASNNSSVKRVLALQGENMSIANENVLEDISTINIFLEYDDCRVGIFVDARS